MAECRRGRGGTRGCARPFGRRKKIHHPDPSSFEISEDGTQFRFPIWQNTPKDPSLTSGFSASLKSIGGYSEDEEKNFCSEKSYMNFMNMQYYPSHPSRELKVNLNLSLGENMEPFTGSPKQAFDNLLTWILSNEDVFAQTLNLDQETQGNGGKFVSIRNVLSEICVRYNNKMENSFLATCFHDVIYLFRIKEMDSGSIHDWAYVFEQMITHNQRTHNKVICNTNYRVMMFSCLGEHRMISSGATDCFHPDKYTETMEDTSALISLKCSYDNPENYKTMKLERYKMFNWCLGLYLSGAPEIVVGYRNFEGTVELLKLYDKNDLMEKGKGYWDMECVFAFLRHLLSFVKERTESKPGAIFHFVKKDHSNIYTCSESEEEILPEWFKNEFKTDPVPRD